MPKSNYYTLKKIFDSGDACIEYLYEHKAIYNEVKCQKHNIDMSKFKKQWRCKKKDCNKRISIFKDSFFAHSKLKVNEIMYFIHLKLNNASSSSICSSTGHSSKTVAFWLQKYRETISQTVQDNNGMIGGPGTIVEIDETLISRRENPWTGKNGVWVFGGIERTPEKRVFAQMVPDRTRKTLFDIIKNHINPGSIIISDCWAAYKTIFEDLGMEHMTVDHSKNFKDPVTGAHTNNIESSWNILKRNVPNSERIPEKVDEYIFEFIWKRQNQKNLWEAFMECLATTRYF